MGNVVHDCDWGCRPAGTFHTTRKVLELSLVLIVALTMAPCIVPYVRTMCVTLLLCLHWNDVVPACSYAKQVLEAILSRLGTMCRVCPQRKTLEHTLDLFFTTKARNEQDTGRFPSVYVTIMSGRLHLILLAITTNRRVHLESSSEENDAFIAVSDDTQISDQTARQWWGDFLPHIPHKVHVSSDTCYVPPHISRPAVTILRTRDPCKHVGRDAHVHGVFPFVRT